MAELSTAFYRDGAEAFVRFGTEAAPIGVSATSLAAMPTMAMIGYGGKPTINRRNNQQAVRGAGSYLPIGFVAGRTEYTVSHSMILSGGANGKKFVQGGLRNTGTGVYANATRTMCLPNIAMDFGAIGACDATRSYLRAARHGLLQRVAIRGTQGGFVTVEYELLPIVVKDGTAITQTTLKGGSLTVEDALLLAGGTPFSFHDAYFDVTPYGGGTAADWAPIVSDWAIEWTNNISLVSTRHPGNTDTSLDLTARGHRVGNQDTTVSFTFEDQMPDTPGTLSLLLDNGVETMTIAVSALAVNEENEGAADPGSPFQFTTPISATQLTIS